MTHEQVHLNQTQAEALCEEWQAVLGLSQWDVFVKIVRGNGLHLPHDLQGSCEWALRRHEAIIKLMDPVDYDPEFCRPLDMEVTLVHELLHLHFAPFDHSEKGSPDDIATEQVIHHLSEALVRLKRAKAPRVAAAVELLGSELAEEIVELAVA